MDIQTAKKLSEAVSCEVKTGEMMKLHTSFRIGGPADYFASPDKLSQIRDLIRVCKEEGIDWTIIGNGSNLLVGDGGYRGLIIRMAQAAPSVDDILSLLDEAELSGEDGGLQIVKNAEGSRDKGSAMLLQGGQLLVPAGDNLTKSAALAAQYHLSGMEFAYGIPGSIGGAVFMNAGAYGGEMKDIVKEVIMFDEDMNVIVVPGSEMKFGYRTSRAQKERFIVLGALLSLDENGDDEAIRARMDEVMSARRQKQPLELPSAGSTFKRPKDNFAGKLIMEAGLRGFRVGDAQVSEKHCGFVVNRGEASAASVLELIQIIQDKVYEGTGIMLEREVQLLGVF